MNRSHVEQPGPLDVDTNGPGTCTEVTVNEHKNLLMHYAESVAAMRQAQKLITPGCPRALREAADALEREVDELTSLHLLPDLPDLPAPEVRQ